MRYLLIVIMFSAVKVSYAQTTNEQKLQSLMNKYKNYEHYRSDEDARTHIHCDSIYFSQKDCKTTYNFIKYVVQLPNRDGVKMYFRTQKKYISSVIFDWKNIDSIRYNVIVGTIKIFPTTTFPTVYSNFTKYDYELEDSLFTGNGFNKYEKLNQRTTGDEILWFTPKASDNNGDARRDIMEIIDLIKKIKNDCGGGVLTVFIKEN